MNASLRPQCLLGTCQVLSFVASSLTTPSEDRNALWLYGLAGSGKSTIPATVAEYPRGLDRLAAFIFFDRNNPTHSDPSSVVRALAHRLASFDSQIQSAICTAIESDNSVVEAPIQRQFANLLLDPLERVATLSTQDPVVILIDALDECDDSTSRKNLLRLLVDELSNLSSTLRFLITSQEESDIHAALTAQPNIVKSELAVTINSNISNILLFLDDEITNVRKHHSVWFGD